MAELIGKYRKILEQADRLKGAGEAGLGPLVRPETVERITREFDRSLVLAVHTREQVEHRRFARAVGADKAVQPARRQVKREARYGLQAAEGLADPLGFQHQSGHREPPAFLADPGSHDHADFSHTSRTPKRPLGRKIMIRMRARA